jgi:hydrophobic/amphiphilic exporter-1 (mainly G- bacteria), HAE1 family
MGMTRLAVYRPLTALMGILGLVLMGAVSYTYLKVDRLPPLNFPFVSVVVSYPNAAAQDVEQLVTKPIEDTVSGVPGIASISSTSSEGQSVVRINFVEDADPTLSALDVERRVSAIRGRLPADAGIPSVRKADPNSFPIMNVALTGAPLDVLYDLATSEMAPALQSVIGVANVNISGGIQREIQVKVDYSKLAAYNLTVTQIANALTAANVSSTVGRAQEGSQSLDIRTVGRFETPEELSNLVIAQTTAGAIVLRDLATVEEGYKERSSYQRINGQEAVGISIVKDSSANALQVADDVRETLDRLKRTLPEGTDVLIRNDQSVFTRSSLRIVQTDLLLAVFLVGIVVLLFLHAWRNVFIILLAIPTSLVSTFFVMYLMGFTINIMTLMALALMIGILVDDSIVCIENIHRHLRMGKEPKVAAVEGRREIGLAAMAITFADVVVYAPIAFMSGTVGQLFRQYGLTVVTATLFSLLMSFTLTPMLASRWLKHDEHPKGFLAAFGRRWDAGFDRLAGSIDRLVPMAIRLRWGVVMIALALVASALALIQFRMVGTEYVPPEDTGNFDVNLSLPPGVSLEATDHAAREMEALLADVPEVQSVFANVSRNGSGGRGNFTVQLTPKHDRERSVFEIMEDVRREGGQIPGARVRTSVPSPLGGGAGGNNISINVSGPDIDVVNQVVSQVEFATQDVEGLTRLQSNSTAGSPQFQLVLDSARLAQLNVTAQQVTDALRTTLGGRVVTVLRPSGKPQQDITLIASDVDRQNLNNIMAIPIRGGATGNAAAGQPVVTLGQVATVKYGTGPVEIERVDRNRTVQLSGSATGRPLGEVARDLKVVLDGQTYPAGYQVRMRGSVDQLNTALAALGQALVLSVVLEYMLLVALFGSLIYPLVLMVAVPLGLVGSLFGLYVTGNTINIFSLIGLIMGFGLVAKNGILLVDFTNQLRGQGMPRTQALTTSAKTRLRPILMTSCTMIFGMFPLALKFEEGAESRAPMAVVVIGAIATSTLLAVFVVPAIYTLFDDFQGLFARRRVTELETAPVPTPVPVPSPEPAHPIPAGAGVREGVAIQRHEGPSGDPVRPGLAPGSPTT